MKDTALNPNPDATAEKSPFVLVKDVESLLPILESRISYSPQVYNTALMYPKFQKELNFYTLNLEGEEVKPGLDTWIICTIHRTDIGQDIEVSIPPNAKPTPEIKNAFKNSKLFHWNSTYCFAAIDRSISSMFTEISVEFGNVTTIFPCYFYLCPPEEALALDTSHGDEVELRPLDTITGTEFIYRTWKYSKEGSMEYISQVIERNISSGVFTRDGKTVSGIVTISGGAMGMLHTDRAYRNKNYGKLCMQNLMKELAKSGFIPASGCEICNEVSKKFHEKIGMKICNTVDYVRCDGPTVFK